MENKIDLVITWVDGNDPIWLKEKNSYLSLKDNNRFIGASNRYEDNGLLRYLFRGVEKYMPWLNKIYFVTYGHLPKWLNVNNEKLIVVKHSDFVPKEYLPTFNSNTILLNLYRIKGLSEHFIFFNDDMFVVNKCNPNLFFKKGLPRDMAVMNPVVAPDTDPFWDMMINNVMVVNKSFNKTKTIRNHPFKWYSPRYGLKNILRNLSCSIYCYFPGFYETHIPNSYLKSEYIDYWDKNYDICNETCKHRFRNENNITEWGIRYWQLAKNKFYPINKNKIGAYSSLKDGSSIHLLKKIKHKKLICLNDECDDEKLEIVKSYFDKILGEKSSYEID